MTSRAGSRLDPLLNPRSIALVGVSATPGKVGYQVIRNLVDQGYGGAIYPVHPAEKEIAGLRTYRNLRAVEADIDLLAIMVPPTKVAEVLLECKPGQVKSAVIYAAGFAESGADGAALQQNVLRISRERRIAVLGPNTNAFVNGHAGINLTFQPFPKLHGSVAVVSQSGAIGTSLIYRGLKQSIGFSKFVSLGNRIDVDETEVLDYLAEDPSISAVAVYLEGIGRGQGFMSAAKRAALRKPVLVLKSGTTSAGRRSALSHTASLSGADAVCDAAFRQCGVIRVSNLSELLDGIATVTSQPPMKGSSVGIVTSAGGMGTISADCCERSGLAVPALPQGVADRLRSFTKLPIATGNPVDMILGDDRLLEAITQEFLSSSEFHGVIWNIVVNPFQKLDGLVNVWRRQAPIARKAGKPVVCCVMGRPGTGDLIQNLRKEGLPTFDSPEKAVFGLSKLREYSVLTNRL